MTNLIQILFLSTNLVSQPYIQNKLEMVGFNKPIETNGLTIQRVVMRELPKPQFRWVITPESEIVTTTFIENGEAKQSKETNVLFTKFIFQSWSDESLNWLNCPTNPAPDVGDLAVPFRPFFVTNEIHELK